MGWGLGLGLGVKVGVPDNVGLKGEVWVGVRLSVGG